MSEIDTPSDEDDGDAETTSAGENPFIHVDYRVFEISVHGGEGDTLEDVEEAADDRLDKALQHIEELKRTDFELDDEFDVDRSGNSGPSFS